VDKQELVSELGKLSEKDGAEVIDRARKNDQRRKMEAGADALRRFVHGSTPRTTEPTDDDAGE
jgi:hypothetical protein